MKFIYVGQHEDSPASTKLFGYTFVRNGEPVDVEEDKFVAKLEGHPSFKKPAVKKPAAKKPAAKKEPPSFGV